MKNPFTSIRLFYRETMTELKKATWPTKTELRDSTIVVLIAVLILGAFTALTDFSLMNSIELLTSWVRSGA